MKENFEVIVNRKPEWDAYEVFLINRVNGKVYNHHVTKDGAVEAVEIKEGDYEPKPLLRIPGLYWQEIVRAISKDLPNVTKDEVDAELKATKYHLEDMRKLVLKDL